MLAAALAAACCTVSTVQAGTACGPSGYAYAGFQPSQTGYGVAATLSALATPIVESGHVAGWVGVGGPGQGPGGTAEWIQVGLNSLPGTSNKLYYEIMQPDAAPAYAELDTDIAAGRALRLAVLEVASAPGSWRIWVNGQPVTGPIALPGSHGALAPMAMGESWDGGQPACNRYTYRFQGVSIAAAPGGAWKAVTGGAVLQDSGYRVIKRAAASFDATATRVLPAAPAPARAAAPAGGVEPAKPAAATPAPAVATRALASAQAVAANAPLRKGFVPTPSLDAILGVTPAPEPVAPVDPAPSDDPNAVVGTEDANVGLGVAVLEQQA